MGWFNKNKKEEMPKQAHPQMHNSGSLPELPKLPDLPELPDLKKPQKKETSRLPSIPNNSFGKKFSQDSIKEAVSGKHNYPEEKRGGMDFGTNDFAMPKKQMMPKHPKNTLKKSEFAFPRTEEIEPENDDFDIEDFESPGITEEFDFEPEEKTIEPQKSFDSDFSKREPVFIRIDKFEEALKTFEKTKKEVAEIEKVLHDIAKVREDEDKELENWQQNILKIKDQVEKVDNDIFSRIE